MAVLTNTAVTFFGDRENRKQMILGIPAKAEADKPGLILLQDVDDSAVIGNHYMWFDSANTLRVHTSIPTDQDGDGTAVGSGTGASKALDDLAAVQINATLKFDTDNTYDIGEAATEIKDIFIDGVAYIDDARLDIAQIGGATNYINVAAGGITTMAGSATIDGVSSGNLLDKSAAEVITGGFDVTTADLDIKEDSRKVTFGAAGSTDSYIEFDGTDMLFFDSNVAGTVTLSQLQAGTTLNPVVTGDLTIAEGKFNWTDSVDETAAAWSFANTGAGADIGITSSCTTGEVIKITADAMANGSAILVDCDGGVGASGFYLECYDGSATDLTIGDNGEINIKGAAIDILTVDLGNILATAGDITSTLGDIVATQGNITATLGNINITDGNFNVDEGKIEVDSTADEISYIKRNNATGTGPAFEIEETHVNGGVALLVDHNVTDAIDAVQITHDGSEYGLSIVGTNVAGRGLYLAGPASQASPLTFVDGTTGAGWVGAASTGMVMLNSDGTQANAGASILRIADSGATAAAMTGSCLQIQETSSGGATGGYAVYINASGDTEALHVDAGTVVVDETIKATAGVITVNSENDVTDPPSQAEMDTAFGAGAAGNDGMIGIINDTGAGANTWLCVNTDGAWYYAAKLTIGA